LASASSDYIVRKVRIFEISSCREISKLKSFTAYSVAFSPDSRWLAIGANAVAYVREAKSDGERIKIYRSGIVRSVAFSPDGRWVAIGGQDGMVSVVNAATGSERVNFRFGDQVYCVAFSPDGRWLATGGQDRTARVLALNETH